MEDNRIDSLVSEYSLQWNSLTSESILPRMEDNRFTSECILPRMEDNRLTSDIESMLII